ncbi:patatin-like phospholipase family protein [Clostridium sp. C105KSO13]|uniref:patatin-like phospholipase family protein n=1 Tax=Clostridium sp. C105KSO13 TaxID=1776045 RepID=UPI00074058D1|nr:patatin family protein [Clostridium sp. C105KSO13]CUX41595.1 Patatin-like phospholipase [Clostridium sp. C105KSO13]
MQKATLVLEGGATRGVFTSGVLDYLMEQDLYMSHVIGVSAGSCNAVDYVSRQPGRTRDCMIPSNKSESYFYSFGKFMKERSLMNMDLIFDIFPNQIYPFDYETYLQSEIKCELVVTNCLTGQAEYIDERSDRDKLMKICRASSSMPLVTPIVNVDDTPYLDGGLADSVPVRHAMEAENEKIVVILTRNAGYRKKKLSNGMIKIYRRAYQSYPNLVKAILTRSLYYNHTMNYLEALERQGKIFVLRPLAKPVARMEKKKENLTAFYNHGYDLMKKEYERLMKYLES